MGGRGTASGLTPATPETALVEPERAPREPEPAPREPETVTYGRLPVSEAEYMAEQDFSAATEAAIERYLDPHRTPGSMYSPSQQLNYKLREGTRLTAAEKRMAEGLDAGMHDLGYDLNLTRYDRVGYIKRLLGRTHEGMSESELRSALIGREYTDPAFVSVSHDRFRHAPAGEPFTDKTVEIRVHAKKGTKALMPGDGAGGRLGEIVLGRKQTFRIVDVKMPAGVRGRSGSDWYQKVVVTVEVG